jgi:hypothetical protein
LIQVWAKPLCRSSGQGLWAGKTLIVAPLSVAHQTVEMARNLLGVSVHYTRSANDVVDGINITNYEMIEKFDPSVFDGVCFDESSIFAALGSKTLSRVLSMFRDTPYMLCCTATPVPNQIDEIVNHAVVLGVASKRERSALALFTHDDEGWRLRRHAQDDFYRWLASWGMSLHLPSDLGYSDDGYCPSRTSRTPHMAENGT